MRQAGHAVSDDVPRYAPTPPRNGLLLRLCVVALCAALSVLAGSKANAQSDVLFVPLAADRLADVSPAQGGRMRSLQQNSTTASLQLILVNLSVLDRATATLPLASDGTVRANRSKLEVRTPTDFTWSGKLPDTNGQAIFVVQNGDLTGHIQSGLNIYSITPLGGGLHALVKIDHRKFPPDHSRPPPQTPRNSREVSPPSPTTHQRDVAADHVQVDVLIAWTVSARTAYGGNMAALAQLSIDAANIAYTNSNANVFLRLAGTMEVNYSDTDFEQSLSDLRNGTGVMSAVHTQRNAIGADLVSLFINNSSFCGLAYLDSDATYAFSTVNYSCAVDNHSFAHELGHNFGANHDPFVEPSNLPFAYGHGYVNPDLSWRTIMAYVNQCVSCPRLQYFSNPSASFQGAAMGTAATHDNARVHRERVATVAAFKSPPPCTDAYEPNESSQTASGPLASGSSRSGKICTSTDVDWFKVNIATPGALSFSLTVPAAKDYDLELYGPSNTLVASSNNAVGQNEAFSYTASTVGTYYLRVFGFIDSFDASNPYTLSYSFIPDPALSVGAGSLTSSGNKGGPFSPASTSYTVTNTGSGTMDFSAGANRSWVTVSPGAGSLAAGASTSVTVSINANANALAAATTPHAASVAFRNITNGIGDTNRSVSLTVNLRPTTTSLSAVPTSSRVGQFVTFTATVTAATGTPTGTVVFKEGTKTLGTGTLSGGVAAINTGTLTAGPHLIRAYYGGTTSLRASASLPVSHIVNPPVPPELAVNTFKAGDQHLPSVASLTNGGYVVTWQSKIQDGSGYGIYSQRYAVTGAKAGGEVRVNTFTPADQREPSVTGLSGGSFVVVWTSKNPGDFFTGIYGQRFGTTGVNAGGEFRVNSHALSVKSDPSIAGLSDGGFVVSWTSANQDGSLGGIYGQRYNATGVPQGTEFRVNTVTTSDQRESSVIGLRNGGFIVVWSSNLQDGSGYGVYAQRYTAAGVKAGVAGYRVNTFSPLSQLRPALAKLGDGGFVVAWTSVGQDGVAGSIYGQRYNAAGGRVGSEFRINTTTADNQSFASVTGLTDGGFIVAWASNLQDGSGYGIYAQRYNLVGARVAGEFLINTYTTGDQSLPSAAALASGGYIVTWQSNGQDGSGLGVYGRRFAP